MWLFVFRDCPNDINEAVASLIFASSRCGDLPELRVIRELFGERYGQRFATTASELLPGNLVNHQVLYNLKIYLEMFLEAVLIRNAFLMIRKLLFGCSIRYVYILKAFRVISSNHSSQKSSSRSTHIFKDIYNNMPSMDKIISWIRFRCTDHCILSADPELS